MNNDDVCKSYTCKDCGEVFFLSESDINFFQSRNLKIPARCKGCRDKKRDSNRIFDLRSFLGSYIQRTKSDITNDRTFLDEKIKLIDIDRKTGTIFYQWPKESFLYNKGKIYPLYNCNDGYWKVVE
jgi:hypothetical protein